MTNFLETTADGDKGRPSTPVTPTLILLYVGGTALVEPRRIRPVPRSLPIGRAVESDAGICLDDKRTSRIHAVVQCDSRGQLRIADAGSHNGTFVNGERIEQAALHNGDVVRLGDSLLVARFETDRTADTPCSYLIGCSTAAVQLRSKLTRIATGGVSVLLLGETGTGKEVAARYLHEHSGRSGPLVTVNSSALPESLVESLLFGHTRGAFTGAAPQPGFFRAAHQGTLLLDEVGELPLPVQPKLLRVLEDRIIFPVGAVSGQAVDARLLFATNMNLLEAVSAGRFRADLYARIAEVVVELPPLRARREDIFLLLRNALPKGQRLLLPPALAEALLLHSWPFNIREVVKIAAELSATGDIDAITARLRRAPAAPPPVHVATPPPEPPIEDRAPARERLDEMLRLHHGNVAAVARKLQCPRKYVYRWIEQHALDLGVYRD